MSHEMHNHSLIAYWMGQEGLFGKRELAVLRAIHDLHGATDRAVMMALGYTDPNAVRPRITTLIKRGVLEELIPERDPVTGRIVRTVGIKADPRKPQRQFSFA